MTDDNIRIGVEKARRDVASGRALLVCAYADAAKCRRLALEGSMTLAEFGSRVASLPKDQEIIFFCA